MDIRNFFIFILLTFSLQHLFAQDQKYQKDWKIIDSLEVNGLVRDALKETDALMTKAQRKKDYDNYLKGQLFRWKFIQITQEGAKNKILKEVNQTITEIPFPCNAILETYKAQFLNAYYEENQWQMSNRKAIEDPDKNDLETWSIHYLLGEIRMSYQHALKRERDLVKITIEKHLLLIDAMPLARDYRPTLYDLLAHNALRFSETDFYGVTRPEQIFSPTANDLFAPSSEFQKFKFKSPDSLYSKVNVLRIYQNLERLHTSDKDPAAFVFAQLKRYNFAAEYLNTDTAWKLYINRLNMLMNAYKGYKINGLIKYHLALAYRKRAIEKDHENHLKNPNLNTKAVVLCEEILNEFPASDVAQRCAQLLDVINELSIDVKIAAYAAPNIANRLYLEYKNMDTAVVSIARVAQNFDNDYFPYRNNDDNIKWLKNSIINTSFYTKKTILPKAQDHNQHSTELVLPALEKGAYLVSVSPANGLDKNEFSYGTTQITNLSINGTVYNNSIQAQVLNRNTGAPVENASLRFYNYKDHLQNQKITDDQGFAQISRNNNNDNISYVTAIKDGDTLRTYFSGGYRYYYDNNTRNEQLKAKTLLFLDRSIYRPGQKVYFKGILLKRENDKTEVVPNEYITISVENANGEEIQDFRLKTNEFGSVSSEFTLPKGGLTGSFSITAEEDDADTLSPFWQELADQESYVYSEVGFKVEEYKRPTFEVVFDTVKKAYNPGDSVNIAGTANSFLGAKLAQTAVTYEVYRSSYYKTWWRSKNSGRTQIAYDTTTTDTNGNFKIPFLVSIDKSLTNDQNLVYEYSITATVTDVNGETREASTSIKMGTQNLIATLDLPQNMEQGDSISVKLQALNLNDNPIKSMGTLRIYKLKAPDRILHERLWAAPEIQQIPEDEFIKLFPHEPYENENQKENWEKGTLVYTSLFETDGTFNRSIMTDASWKSGVYRAEVDLQSDSLTATVNKQFTVTAKNDNYLPDNEPFSYRISNTDFRKDGFAEVIIHTAYQALNLNILAFDGDKRIFFKQIKVDGKSSVKIPVDDSVSNKLKISVFGVKNGSFIAENEVISLKTKEKMLVFKTKTFRDKLQPGLDEQWSFSLKNENNEVPETEILASMYDASLDQFTPHSWNSDAAFYSHVDFPSFDSYTLGTIENLRKTFYSYRQVPGFFNAFDTLNLFGFTFDQVNSYQYRNYLDNKKQEHLKAKPLTGNTRGKVTDENGDPIPGVSVIIKKTKKGTETNFDGDFGLNVEEGDYLVFNYLGYIQLEIKVQPGKNLFIMMEEDQQALEEVVTVGYGVAEMKAEASAAPSPNQLLQGNVAGVQITDGGAITIRGTSSVDSANPPLYIIDGEIYESGTPLTLSPSEISSINVLEKAEATAIYGAQAANGAVIITTKKGLQELTQVEARKNLDETAFFLPNLKTDKDGVLSFNFTSPEALTRWKFDMLAHDENYVTGTYTAQVVTQKDLSITPNAPRFLREGDTITFQAKVSNLTNAPMTGVAILQLFDATTMQPIDSLLHMGNTSQNFAIKSKNSAVVSWQLTIPENISAVTYRVLAKAGNFSDGEENILPVLSNRMLVTESIPLFVRAGTTEDVTFTNFKNNDSQTLKNHQFTLEYTSNPAWYAIQALPYLMEFPYECAEQVFARLYANSLGAHIVNSQPKIKEVFESWQENETLKSNLEKNDELKSLIIAETPWLRDAQSETEKKARIAQLFELQKLATGQKEALASLKQKQNDSGAFPWFSGGRDNYYITRHIVAGFGHLNTLGITVNADEMLNDAVAYLDTELLRQERKYLGRNKDSTTFYKYRDHLHALYARSFFLEKNKPSVEMKVLFDKIISAQKEDWTSLSVYEKGLFSLVLQRMGDSAFAEKILENLKQTAVLSDTNGMYWKDNRAGWHWYEEPIETHALLIEAFETIADDPKTVEKLKIWLLQNKRTNSWSTTKATTEASYALLLQGEDWLSLTDNTVIKLGGETIKTIKMQETGKEAGTGYLKLNWKAEEIDQKFAEIKVKNNNTTAGYGRVYWQYFENLDKIKSHNESPLRVEKELYLNVNEGAGKVLKKISEKTPLKVGDLITVRLVVKSNATMEFIHLKDMRASGFEPTNVLSEYKYQDGTAYYESTKDAATHFFCDELQQGTSVLEYTVRANNAGNFSNGTTLIESMYAPEFSGHTQGIRVDIEDRE
ncbi:MAG TPA: hypothetical protein ENH91_01455 [Leeuwenhoekiella sp.]|nr:hypothetical protein [Leeuwenhoekiella sp.]